WLGRRAVYRRDPGRGKLVLCYSHPAFFPAGSPFPKFSQQPFRGQERLMRIRLLTIMSAILVALALASPADAQYGARHFGSDRATGETYNVEVSGLFWNPTPDIVLSSAVTGSLAGLAGTNIDFQTDLGIEKKKLNQLKLVLRPGTKHKCRFEYTPSQYTS